MNPNLYFALYTDDNEAPGLGVHRGHQSWGWSCSSRKRNGGIGAALYLPERFLKVKLWTIWGLIQIACPYRMCDRHMARINSLTSPLPLLPPSSCNEFVHEHASNKMIGLIMETNEALSNLVDNNGNDTQCFLVSAFKKLSHHHPQHFQKFEALSQVFLPGRNKKKWVWKMQVPICFTANMLECEILQHGYRETDGIGCSLLARVLPAFPIWFGLDTACFSSVVWLSAVL